VVGYIETGGDAHAFLWSSGVTTDLGTLGGGISSATDINSRGQVVGSSLTEVGEPNAFLWENGVMTNVGFFDFARATGINSRGDVAGNFGQGGGLGAFLRLDGVIHRLEPQEPDGFIQVADINSRRQVVGFSDGGAVLWENGVITDLGPGFANAINDSGQVVGGSVVGSSHAFLWDNGVFTDLGTLGGDISVALGINGSGQVVGRSETAAGQTHAFLWEKGVMTDLGTLGGSQSVASAINDAGQIVGSSETASGETRATLWIRE
jgi:probable HAF family extracellular repeat protein